MNKSGSDIYSQLEQYIQQKCAEYYVEVRGLLPELPVKIKFSLDNSYLISGTASGGATLSSREIAIAFDPFFGATPEEIEAQLRQTIFHESYHVAQNFTFEGPLPTPIDNAIYEGAATVFERDVAGSKPGWGDYPKEVANWVYEVKNLSDDYDWRKWKFYDPETDRRWILYRVGTYIVDKALVNNPELTIVDLASKSANDILRLAKL